MPCAATRQSCRRAANLPRAPRRLDGVRCIDRFHNRRRLAGLTDVKEILQE